MLPPELRTVRVLFAFETSIIVIPPTNIRFHRKDICKFDDNKGSVAQKSSGINMWIFLEEVH